MIHFKLIIVCGTKYDLRFFILFFVCRCPVSYTNLICWWKDIFIHWIALVSLSQISWCVDLFLNCPFCSVDLCVYPSPISHHLEYSLWFYYKSLNQAVWGIHLCCSFSQWFWLCWLLCFAMWILAPTCQSPPPPTSTKKKACGAFAWDYIGSIAQFGVN